MWKLFKLSFQHVQKTAFKMKAIWWLGVLHNPVGYEGSLILLLFCSERVLLLAERQWAFSSDELDWFITHCCLKLFPFVYTCGCLMQTVLQEMFRTSIPTPAIQNRDIPFCSAKREKWVINRYKLWMKDAGCCAGAWDTPQRSRRNVRRFQSIVVFYQLLAQKLSRKRKIGRLKKKKKSHKKPVR